MTNTPTLTKDDLRAVLRELDVATKADLEQFATKTDLERFATKEDLKALASKADLARLERSTKDGFAKNEEGFAKQEKKMHESLLHLERRLKLRMGKHRNEIFAMVGRLATSTPRTASLQARRSSETRRYNLPAEIGKCHAGGAN